jgi:hypothetical protein
MNWYLALLIFQVRSGAATPTPRFDKQWRLIRADELAWAIEKAEVLGRLEETNLLNTHQETAAWKFVAVSNIVPIHHLEDGAVIFSATEEPANANEFVHAMQVNGQKSLALARQEEPQGANQFA